MFGDFPYTVVMSTSSLIMRGSTHLFHGSVNHMNEKESYSFVVDVLHFAIVLINVVLDSIPTRA